MATINYLYRSVRDSASLVLRLLYRHDNQDYVYGVKSGIIVSKHYWNKEHKKKNPRDVDLINKQTEINSKLSKLKSHILKRFNETETELVNKKWLEQEVSYFHHPLKSETSFPNGFLEYFNLFIEEKRSELTNATIKKYNVIANLVSRYEDNTDKKLLIKDIDLNFKRNFEEYCIKNDYAHNTITRAIRAIKTICNHAKLNEVETSLQLDRIKVRYKKSKSIYLTIEDIEKIKNIDKQKLSETYDNARDWLIISCFTGQRISDFMRFSKDKIRIEKGKHLLEFTQQKTGTVMTIPLNKEVLKILEKRDGHFPKPIASQKYNSYIKSICKEAKINDAVSGGKLTKIEDEHNDKFPYRKESGEYKKWQLVTSHIGRRSFATNYYGKIPTSFLMYMTGHKTEQMFLNYIGKSNKDIALELTKYF